MIKVTVTQKDIDKGKQWDCEKCPVALALKRIFKDNIDVSWSNLKFTDTNVYLMFDHEVRNFIANFDNKKNVKPFSFYLG